MLSTQEVGALPFLHSRAPYTKGARRRRASSMNPAALVQSVNRVPIVVQSQITSESKVLHSEFGIQGSTMERGNTQIATPFEECIPQYIPHVNPRPSQSPRAPSRR